MEKRTCSPWKYQDELGYVQAVEVKSVEGTLYCAGQAAMDGNGNPSTADMKSQLAQVLGNLKEVIENAGYHCSGLVRMTIFTTSAKDFLANLEDFKGWTIENNAKVTATLIEVKGLAFDSLKVEIEAIAVK